MADENQILTKIAESKLFADISSDALDEIASIAREKVFQDNAILFKDGEPSDNCYIVSSGAVDLSRESEDGTKYVYMQLVPGDSFGALALMTEFQNVGTKEAVGETILIEIPRDKFEPILMKHADVIHALGAGISENVHMAIPALEKEVSRRFIAPYLSWLDFVIIVGLSVLFSLGFNAANQKGIPLFQNTTLDEAVSFVSPLTAFEKHKKGKSLFVDAMPTNFYEKEHIPGAENLPLNLFDFMYELTLTDVDKKKEIIVYGRSISRRYDEQVANKLSIRGHKKVQVLKGGLSAWKKMGCPVEP